jgi:hypothetical protein
MSSHNPLFFPIRPRSLTYSLYPLAMDLRRLHPRLCINSRPRTRSAGDGLRRHPLCTLSLSEGGHFKNLKSLSRPQARKRSIASRRPAPPRARSRLASLRRSASPSRSLLPQVRAPLPRFPPLLLPACSSLQPPSRVEKARFVVCYAAAAEIAPVPPFPSPLPIVVQVSDRPPGRMCLIAPLERSSSCTSSAIVSYAILSSGSWLISHDWPIRFDNSCAMDGIASPQQYICMGTLISEWGRREEHMV